MWRFKLERFPDGDDEEYIAYGYDEDGRPLYLMYRDVAGLGPNDTPPDYIWLEVNPNFTLTKEAS